MSSLTQAAPVDLALVRRLERSALLAVPAEQEWEVGGWLCRWGADGRVGRVASACVSPFGPARADLAPVAEVAAARPAVRARPARAARDRGGRGSTGTPAAGDVI